MRVITISTTTKRKVQKPMVACIGYFDGLHLGHQALIHQTIALSKQLGCESALITFDPDPWVTIRHLKEVQHISTMRQRMNQAIAFGIDNIVILSFDQAMASLSHQDFLQHILDKVHLKGLVCGFDFHYGKNGEGNVTTLKQNAKFPVYVVEAIADDKGKISSSRISQEITLGNVKEVRRLLGHPYLLEGQVIHGQHRGSSIGFPTANIALSKEYIMPKPGVYACFATVDDQRYAGMCNIGHNPTFNYQQELSFEVHLFHIQKDLYGKRMQVELVQYIRPEMKFKNIQNLILQLNQDQRDIQRILEHGE